MTDENRTAEENKEVVIRMTVREARMCVAAIDSCLRNYSVYVNHSKELLPLRERLISFGWPKKD